LANRSIFVGQRDCWSIGRNSTSIMELESPSTEPVTLARKNCYKIMAFRSIPRCSSHFLKTVMWVMCLQRLRLTTSLVIPRFTHGGPSLIDEAAKQQYLTFREETSLTIFYVRTWLPYACQILRSLALVIARLRPSASRNSASDDSIRPLDRNWPEAFYKHHCARCYQWRLAAFGDSGDCCRCLG
jgi:hypothetical protein